MIKMNAQPTRATKRQDAHSPVSRAVEAVSLQPTVMTAIAALSMNAATMANVSMPQRPTEPQRDGDTCTQSDTCVTGIVSVQVSPSVMTLIPVHGYV